MQFKKKKQKEPYPFTEAQAKREILKPHYLFQFLSIAPKEKEKKRKPYNKPQSHMSGYFGFEGLCKNSLLPGI